MKYLKYLLLSLFIIGAISSCDMFDTGTTQTKTECLTAFLGKAQSGNWDNMYKQLHPTAFPSYNSYKSGSLTFSSIFNTDLTYSNIRVSGNTITVSVDPLGSGISEDEVYYFQENGSDYWLISSFTH